MFADNFGALSTACTSAVSKAGEESAAVSLLQELYGIKPKKASPTEEAKLAQSEPDIQAK